MASFPKFLIIIDVLLVALRLVATIAGGALSSAAAAVGKVPVIGGVLKWPVQFLATIFIKGKLLLTILLVAAVVVTLFFVIRWLKAKRDLKRMKNELTQVKHQRKLDRIAEGNGTGERIANLAEDTARTGLKAADKMTSFLP